jgi:hypothetical protein
MIISPVTNPEELKLFLELPEEEGYRGSQEFMRTPFLLSLLPQFSPKAKRIKLD